MPIANENVSRFRTAISSGEFEKAAAFWNAYCSEIAEEIRRGVCTGARLGQARDLLEWARRVAMCSRATALHRLSLSQSGAQAAIAYARIATGESAGS